MTHPAERKNIKNTFLPEFVNKKFSVEELADMCRIGTFDRYPPEIQKLVRDELDFRRLQRQMR